MTGPSRKTLSIVDERAEGNCEFCSRALDLFGKQLSRQHRIPRGMGGSKDPKVNAPSNLIVLCGSATTPGGCHHRAESRRIWAMENGLLLGRHTNPASAPVLYRGRWALLTDDGAVHFTDLNPMGDAA